MIGRVLLVTLVLALGVVEASPAGAAVRRVVDSGAVCDGSTNDRSAIQSAINAAGAGDAVEFPARSCAYSGVLYVTGKSQIDLYGFGQNTSVLKALDPLHSALKIASSTNVVVRDLGILSVQTIARQSDDNADGIYIVSSTGVTVRAVAVTNAAAAGILVRSSSSVLIDSCFVATTRADGVHVTGGSSVVTVQNNYAYKTEDDGFSSISYVASGSNQHIGFYHNIADDTWGSGVAVEGGQFIEVHNNTAYKTHISGIRVASDGFWQTGGPNEVSVRWNLVDQNLGGLSHGAIHVWADYLNVTNVHVTNNTINETGSWSAVRVYGEPGTPAWATSSQVQDNTVYDSGGITDCINVGPQASGITVSGNTLNGLVCN